MMVGLSLANAESAASAAVVTVPIRARHAVNVNIPAFRPRDDSAIVPIGDVSIGKMFGTT